MEMPLIHQAFPARIMSSHSGSISGKQDLLSFVGNRTYLYLFVLWGFLIFLRSDRSDLIEWKKECVSVSIVWRLWDLPIVPYASIPKVHVAMAMFPISPISPCCKEVKRWGIKIRNEMGKKNMQKNGRWDCEENRKEHQGTNKGEN